MEDKKNEKKLGTKKKLSHNYGKVVVGTVDKKDTKSCFVRLETWMTVEESLDSSIEKIRRRFIKQLGPALRVYFDGDVSTYMVDYDYSSTPLTDKPGRQSFVAIEITLLAKRRFDYNKDFEFVCYNFGDTCFSLLESLSEHFSMSVSKTKKASL